MTVKDIRFYVATEPEKLQALCVKNNLFTCGTGRQYEKLFTMNEIEKGFSLHEMALIIWACSDTGDNRYSAVKVEDLLEEAQEEYLKRLEAIVKESQETA